MYSTDENDSMRERRERDCASRLRFTFRRPRAPPGARRTPRDPPPGVPRAPPSHPTSRTSAEQLRRSTRNRPRFEPSTRPAFSFASSSSSNASSSSSSSSSRSGRFDPREATTYTPSPRGSVTARRFVSPSAARALRGHSPTRDAMESSPPSTRTRLLERDAV